MDRGLYLAASGMLAEQVRQNQIANDLANASTPGYKADRTTQQSFGSMLLGNSVTGETIGSQTTAVQVTGEVTDWTSQPVKDTGEPVEQRTAFGSAADVARVIETYHAAGATSVVLQPAGDDPDGDATLALGAEAIALLAR